jgi:D-alanine-D-alanine ligase
VLRGKQTQVFPPREIFFTKVPEDAPKFATFSAKWDEAYRKKWGIKNGPAADLPDGVPDAIEALARTVGSALKIRGPGRVDVRLTPQNDLVVIEANPNPSLAHDEDFAQAALQAGVEYDTLVQRILDDALRRPAGPHG